MKKLLLTGISFMLVIQAFGQLNSITNLNWVQWHIERNYFRLTWNVPELSEDTLVGYNIYRDNDFYRFQSDSILHLEELCGNCTVEFLDYNNNGDFWIHVTALYNSTKLESEYEDSVYNMGTMISISKIKQREVNLFPNPAQNSLTIDIQKPYTKIVVEIIDEKGCIIYKKASLESPITLNESIHGLYFVKLSVDNEIITKKILIE